MFETNTYVRPIERKIIKVKPGKVFVRGGYTYVVKKVYSHHALCKREDDVLECFTVGDFVMWGMEDIEPNNVNCMEV